MERVFVDTSAWFAYANSRDKSHTRVREALEKWENRLVTSNFVFDETVTLLMMRGGGNVALKMGEGLRDPGLVRLMRLVTEDEEEAWSIFSRHKDKNWSFTDCTSFALMRRLGLDTAIAVDDHFKQAGFNILPN